MRKVIQRLASEIVVMSFRRGVVRFIKYEARKKLEELRAQLESIREQQLGKGG